MTPGTILALWAGLAAAMLALVALGLFPRTRWNQADSYNTLFAVRMQPTAYYMQTGQSMRGVHAQERVECFLRWVALVSIVGVVLLRTRWFFRQSELIGHAAEIVVAGREGFGRETYLHDEAARTWRSAAYRGIFDHLDLEAMKRALWRRFWIARALVAVNAAAIGRRPPVR